MGPFSSIGDPNCSQDNSYLWEIMGRVPNLEKPIFASSLFLIFYFLAYLFLASYNSIHFGIPRGPEARSSPAGRTELGQKEGKEFCVDCFSVGLWISAHVMELEREQLGNPGVRSQLAPWPREQASFWVSISPSGLSVHQAHTWSSVPSVPTALILV